MRTALGILAVLATFAVSYPAQALSRYASDGPFYERTAFSTHVGAGLPIGDFRDEKFGDHENGLDWYLDLEHFFGVDYSFGLTFGSASFDDRVLGDSLTTNVRTFGVFFRYVFVQPHAALHPYMRFGLSSMRVQFEEVVLVDENDPGAGSFAVKDDAESQGALVIAAGATLTLGSNLALDGALTYHRGFTQNAIVTSAVFEPTIVGFDVQYFSFNVGLSVYFP